MPSDRFKNEPPGWVTYEELLENLIYYLIENSSYVTLAKEDMPESMLNEMKLTMESIAKALFRNIESEVNTWELLKNGNILSAIGGEIAKINIIEDKGIKIDTFITTDNDGVKSLNLRVKANGDSETGKLENLTSHNVRVDFKTDFSITPVGEEPQVYRMNTLPNGNWRKEEVRFYFTSLNWLDHTGFNLTIDPDENLEGIVIEYEFTEPL